MLVALKPLHDEVGIARINVATYQSVSGSGKEGVSELAGQTLICSTVVRWNRPSIRNRSPLT